MGTSVLSVGAMVAGLVIGEEVVGGLETGPAGAKETGTVTGEPVWKTGDCVAGMSVVVGSEFGVDTGAPVTGKAVARIGAVVGEATGAFDTGAVGRIGAVVGEATGACVG